MKKTLLTFLSTISLILFDQIIKYYVVLNNTNVVVIKNFMSFIYTKNYGVAFSFLSGNKQLIIIITIVLLMFIINMFYKDFIIGKKNYFKAFTYSFLFAGIFGNFIDRIFTGYVVDYVSLNIFGYYFPIFNLADVLITIGVIFIIVYTIKEDKQS